MKIVTVGYLHGAGGAEKQIILLSNQLAQRGHDISLLILAENNCPYTIDKSVKIIDLTLKEEGRHRILKRLFAFRNAVYDQQPDVIINYNLQSAYFCLTIPKRTRGKVIYSERGDPYDKEYSGLLGMVRDFTLRHIDGAVFQTDGARDFFPESVKQKSIVIHNSVNIPSFEEINIEKREKRIVNLGRLHLQKNQRLLIQSFSKIADIFPDYNLEIYGDGVLHDELQSYIESLNIQNRVFIFPSRKNVWNSIYKASLFVLTSDYEGMPNALLEAMAVGIPCISTDCRPGGARALIKNGENGFIVPCGDAEKLSQQIKAVLENQALQKQMALEARKIAITHSDKEIFDKWDKYINKIVKQ